MNGVNHLLYHCMKQRPSRHTRRVLVGLRSSALYERCCSDLEQRGKRPLKRLRPLGVLCCHMHSLADLAKLRRHPDIAFVEQDVRIRAHEWCQRFDKYKKKGRGRAWKPRITWNIKRVQAPQVWRATRGGPVRVAILDTGIAKHPDLRVWGGVNTIGGASYRDFNGHGTHVAGIAAAIGDCGQLAGVAPRARLYAVKSLNRDGFGYISDIIEGILWCIDQRMNIINMSLGIPPDLNSPSFRKAVRLAVKQGLIITASAGNNGRNSGGIDAPARYPGTIAVAATTRRNRIASFSSRGRGIDVSAPGENILSTSLHCGYQVMSGTSMAAPHVAGGAALLLALRPKLSPAAISRVLKRTARPLRGAGRRAQGAGLIQLRRAARLVLRSARRTSSYNRRG